MSDVSKGRVAELPPSFYLHGHPSDWTESDLTDVLQEAGVTGVGLVQVMTTTVILRTGHQIMVPSGDAIVVFKSPEESDMLEKLAISGEAFYVRDVPLFNVIKLELPSTAPDPQMFLLQKTIVETAQATPSNLDLFCDLHGAAVRAREEVLRLNYNLYAAFGKPEMKRDEWITEKVKTAKILVLAGFEDSIPDFGNEPCPNQGEENCSNFRTPWQTPDLMEMEELSISELPSPPSTSGTFTETEELSISELPSPPSTSGTVVGMEELSISELPSPPSTSGTFTETEELSISELPSPPSTSGTFTETEELSISEVPSPPSTSGTVMEMEELPISELPSPPSTSGTLEPMSPDPNMDGSCLPKLNQNRASSNPASTYYPSTSNAGERHLPVAPVLPIPPAVPEEPVALPPIPPRLPEPAVAMRPHPILVIGIYFHWDSYALSDYFAQELNCQVRFSAIYTKIVEGSHPEGGRINMKIPQGSGIIMFTNVEDEQRCLERGIYFPVGLPRLGDGGRRFLRVRMATSQAAIRMTNAAVDLQRGILERLTEAEVQNVGERHRNMVRMEHEELLENQWIFNRTRARQGYSFEIQTNYVYELYNEWWEQIRIEFRNPQ